MYIDKLDDIVNKCNNTYHRTIKMKPVDVNSSTYIDFDKNSNKEDPKFKIGDQNLKTYLQKTTFQTGLKKFLWLKKLKILFGYMLLVILTDKKTVETFY